MATSSPSLQTAILQTLTYSDLFDYPLTALEIHRYLIGVKSNLDTVFETLTNGLQSASLISQSGEYFTLPGREELTATRLRRATQSARLWPKAMHYGRLMAGFPFVRMVALTGTLAVNNVENDADADYFIVTEPGRLWLCRAFIIGLVRMATHFGITLCPNFFLAENALALPDQTLYVAREIAQMIPLAGLDVYHRIRTVNPWVYHLLPNACGPPPIQTPVFPNKNSTKVLLEKVFHSHLGNSIENWEMNRKIRKLTAQAPFTDETQFSPERCQGHFDGYGKKTMEAFKERLGNSSYFL